MSNPNIAEQVDPALILDSSSQHYLNPRDRKLHEQFLQGELPVIGVDNNAFDLNNQETSVVGLKSQGRLLRRTRRTSFDRPAEHMILITESATENTPQFSFGVYIDKGVIYFDIQSQTDGMSAQDIHATNWVLRTIQELRNQGIEIHTWQSEWHKTENPNVSSINYHSFMMSLDINYQNLESSEINTQLKRKTQEQLKEAVRNTWTGRVASIANFSEIKEIRCGANKIEVDFAILK